MTKYKICACGVLKNACKKHNPAAFCNHGRLIRKCKQCAKHIGVCACGKTRGTCLQHGGWLLCPCGSPQHRSRCTACGTGGKLCKHKKRQNNCMRCIRSASKTGEQNAFITTSSEICPCLIAKKFCKKHGGSHLCVTCRTTVTRTKNTECSPCRRWRDGKCPIKKHESALKTFIDAAVERGDIPQYNSHDKQATLGLDPSLYGSNRPDFLFKFNDKWVILECDESQHKSKSYTSCSSRRELQIYNSTGGLPLVVVRFNPDPFKTGSKSAKVNYANMSTTARHAVVLRAIKHAVETPASGLKFVKLFFDCNCKGEGSKHKCNYQHHTAYIDHTDFLLANQASTAS
jgi:hypothetical protein